MVPAKWSLVNLGESQTTTLVGVLDVGEVIVEVVEGIVASTRLVEVSHSEGMCISRLSVTRRNTNTLLIGIEEALVVC